MRKFAALLCKDLQLYGKKIPVTLLTAALLLCGTALMLGALLADALAGREPMRLALVDNDRSALSDAAINAVANSEDVATLFTVEYCKEDAALRGMQDGTYAAALLFSKDFFSRILDGEDAVTVCLSDRYADAALTVSHFAKTGETLIRAAEYGVMSAWPSLRGTYPYTEANAALSRLELRYATRLLSLPETAFTSSVLPVTEGGVGLAESYLLAFFVFFLLLTEVLFYPFTVRDLAPPMLRRIRSYGVQPSLLLAEKAILPFLLRALLFGILFSVTVRRVPLTVQSLCLSLCALLLCSVLCTAVTVLLSQSRIGLSLWFAIALLGLLLCGGLVPRAMLPYAMLRIGEWLPPGLLMRLLTPLLGGSVSVPALIALLIWAFAALALACRYAGRLCRKGGSAA